MTQSGIKPVKISNVWDLLTFRKVPLSLSSGQIVRYCEGHYFSAVVGALRSSEHQYIAAGPHDLLFQMATIIKSQL